MSEQPATPGALFGMNRELRERFERIDKAIVGLQKKLSHEIGTAAKQAVERHKKVMATIQELRDALAEQNTAILAEIDEVNAALAAAGNIPADVLAQVKGHTDKVKGIVAAPLPPVDPLPPAGRR